MDWAAQDWRTSRIRLRSIRTRDYYLRLVYLEILFALPENGGSIPADPSQLEDLLGIPADVIRTRIPVLQRFAEDDADGGIVVCSGRITNRRVTRELAQKQEFRSEQRNRANKRWSERPKKRSRTRADATALPPHSGGIATALPAQSQGIATAMPIPIPSPIPSPSPSPLPEEEKKPQAEDVLRLAPGGANGAPKLNSQAQRVKNVEDITFKQRGVEPPSPGAIASWLAMVDEAELDAIVDDLESSGRLTAFENHKAMTAYLFACVKGVQADRVKLERKTGATK